MISPTASLILSVILFGVGAYGVLARRQLIIVLMSLEIMMTAAALAFLTFSRVHGNTDGQTFVLFTMAVAAAEAGLGLAIVLAYFRTYGGTDSDRARSMEG